MKKIILLTSIYLILIGNGLIAQNQGLKSLDNQEYEIINDLFSTNNSKVGVYKTTDFSKTWMYLMNPNELDNLLGPPCNDGVNIIKWTDIFSNENFKNIQKKSFVPNQ